MLPVVTLGEVSTHDSKMTRHNENKQAEFVDGLQTRNTKRKSEEEWHYYKSIIIAKYKRMTLDAVMKEMKKEHNFEATYAH